MNYNSKFLDLYREFEGVLRNQNVDYKDIESNSESDIRDKLTICRQMRNYLTHCNNTFLSISDEQIKFLTEIIKEYRLKDDVCKKHLRTAASFCCKPTDKCLDVIQRMIKRKITEIPVYNSGTATTKPVYGVVDIFSVNDAYLKSKTSKISTIKIKRNFIFVKPDTLMNDIYYQNATIFCTSDGTEKGKFLGVVDRG